MGQGERESLDLIEGFEKAWRASEDPVAAPHWQEYLLPDSHTLWAKHAVALWESDIEHRIARGLGPFPRARVYADTAEGTRLAADDLFKLVEAEYRLCWRRNVGSVTRAEYQRLFPDLAARIEQHLWPAWECPNVPQCGQEVVESEEEREPLTCPFCNRRTSRSELVGGGPATIDLSPAVPRPAAGFSLPHRLGQYELRRRIDGGGMGDVYEAQDLVLSRPVAVKVLKPEFAARPDACERFLREAKNQAAVPHNHIVPIHTADTHDGTAYIVMPVLTGETLQTRLKREGKLSSAAVALIGCEAAAGLAAAHAKGLVHRDVKPSNLWLGHPGDGNTRVLLMDFGLARSADGRDRLTAAGALAGTPPYMSPEQSEDQPVDERSDLFSLGCVLYEALTGRRAFPGESSAEVLRAVAETTPVPAHELVPDVNRSMSLLVNELLAKKPSDRPSAAEVRQRLGQIQSRVRRGRGRLLVLAGALAVVVATAVALFVVFTRGERPAAVTPTRYKGTVDVEVGRIDLDGVKMGVRLSDPRAQPLHSGDHVKVVVEVTPMAYLYAFWLDEKGIAAPLYPWTVGKWGTRPAVEEPAERLDIKSANGNWLKISGDAEAMETVLLLARATPLDTSDEEVREWFAGLSGIPLPVLPDDPRKKGVKARAWFQNFDLVRDDPVRGAFGVGRGVEEDGAGSADPLLALQGLLGTRIGNRTAFSRGVSFARLGKKKEGD